MADQVVLGNAFQLAEGMVGHGHGEHAHICQFPEPLITFIEQLRHQAVGHIYGLIAHQGWQLPGRRQVHREAGLGEALFQPAQDIPPDVLWNGVVPGNAQYRFRPAQVMLAAGQYLAGHLVETPAVGEDGLADGGQVQLVTTAFEQLHAQLIFQRGQHGADRGAAAVQLPGSGGYAAVAHHGKEGFDVGGFHGVTYATDFPSLSDSRFLDDADNMAGNSQEVKMFTSLARENLALTLSAVGAGLFALAGITWGLWVDSLVILFDGAYSLIGLGLSLLSLYAARLVRRPANEDYPFGMGAVVPLLQGGRAVAADMAMIFGAVNVVGCLAVWVYLRWSSFRNDSGLVKAEQRQWLMDSALSAAVMIGFAAAWMLERSQWSELAVYADPVMMLVISVYFMTVPVKMVLESVRELLLAAPRNEALDDIHETLEALSLSTAKSKLAKPGPNPSLEARMLRT